jgi:uncharacterized protein (TIGR04562 family)
MGKFNFDPHILNVLAAGQSALDIPRLQFKTLDQAESFIKAYGFNLQNESDEKKLWYYHRRALVLLTERLGFEPNEIPDVLRDKKDLQDLRRLILWASSSAPDESELQRWSCAFLRVMHVFVHTENDLFASFAEEIQKQVLTPFQQALYHDGTKGKIYLKSSDGTESIELLGFESKPFKTSSSAVIKLLAKRDALAMNVFDKLGVRFVTRSMFDAFRVLRFLASENLVSFPHIIPDQSSNNLYPVDLFLEACQKIKDSGPELNEDQVEAFFQAFLLQKEKETQFLRKENDFSGHDYRFIKFITRRLICVEKSGEGFGFFYPYEVQIMDAKSHQSILTGPSEHAAYKERQKEAARSRVLRAL